MDPVSDPDLRQHALGLGLTLASAFLVGRNLARGTVAAAHKPGLRDCLIFALCGALAAVAGQPLVTAALLLGGTLILAVARWQNGTPRGLTSELAVVFCFLMGYLYLSGQTTLAAAAAIIGAFMLAEKARLHHLATTALSDREFIDTLKFLAVIFIIHPLLPEGRFGPYDFFDPRRIWFFVILVSAVSYFGYFFAKFFSEEKGRLLTAVLGGLASTTAYTGAASKIVGESPALAVPMVRATLLANAIMFPRMFILVLVIDVRLALDTIPVLLAMTLAGVLAAWWFGRTGERPAVTRSARFANPFALRPALKFGALFTVVLFLTQLGGDIFDRDRQWITGFIGGLLDVDAVVLSFAESFRSGSAATGDVVLACVLAGSANAVFKLFLAATARTPAFHVRLAAGFLLIFAAGGVALVLR